MRLFTAIDLPGDLLGNLERLIESLRPAARLKWSPAANLHITLKFIGGWPEERLEDLRAALAGVRFEQPIAVEIRGLGFFPDPRSPRIFWAGVSAGPELAALAGQIERALEPLGVEREKRAFSPHLTLARIPEPVPLGRLRREITASEPAGFGGFLARRFCLYRSRPGPAGSVYTRVAEFPPGCR